MSEGSFVSPGIIVQFEKCLWIIASFSNLFFSIGCFLISPFIAMIFMFNIYKHNHYLGQNKMVEAAIKEME